MKAEEYVIVEEPYYLPVADEVDIFLAAYDSRLPVLLKGPTGCGKTRFIAYMSWLIGKELLRVSDSGPNPAPGGKPLITVACHEDLTASDLVGRYLFDGHGTYWCDGPLTLAVLNGGICYLDEIVEARKDTTVLIHPLTDDRRILPVEKKGEIIEAPDDFMLVISYNPGYQSVVKDLKQSTRQRFVTINFDYPGPEIETEIIAHEGGVDRDTASTLATLGRKVRNLKEHGLEEGVSTRLLIYAGQLISRKIDPVRACETCVTEPLTDDEDMRVAIQGLVTSLFQPGA